MTARLIFVWRKDCMIDRSFDRALMLGSLAGDEVRFIGGVFGLAGNGVEEAEVKASKDDLGRHSETSNLRLLKGDLFENVLASDGLLCALVSKASARCR